MTINQISSNNNNNNNNVGHCRICYINSFCWPRARPLENARLEVSDILDCLRLVFQGNMFRDCMKSFKCSSQTLLYKEELMVGRSSIYHTTTLEAASICIYHTTIFKRFSLDPVHLPFEAHTTHDASWLNWFEPPGTVGSWEAILWVASRAGNPPQKAGEKKGNPNHHNARKPFRFRNFGMILSVLPRTWGVVKQRPFLLSWVRW